MLAPAPQRRTGLPRPTGSAKQTPAEDLPALQGQRKETAAARPSPPIAPAAPARKARNPPSPPSRPEGRSGALNLSCGGDERTQNIY
ncbi:hypothetical protein XFF6166_650010 [Xanthomonas citri pv. fuscans]|nr:hypothetical protein XFF6166_650010 [Xanthomonas citri pv. fuscans]SOO03239.1 hypothetical protein XFF6960_830004 [Xanthomonas citri pv. fuscans]SOO05942.1 hypothetical protein XFF7767_530001 [Xanthomonas citri pv. fuscans]SOO07969.1 hypothetical protein XFF6970_130001 [Xanthomonas citri pv. fuscans]SOO14939.1 hypothetical protein XFF7766_450001 [Xanthomonas citri pv. fuscans]